MRNSTISDDVVLKLLYSNNDEDILLGVEYALAKYGSEAKINSKLLDKYKMNLQLFADMVRIRGGLTKEDGYYFEHYTWWCEVCTPNFKEYCDWPDHITRMNATKYIEKKPKNLHFYEIE